MMDSLECDAWTRVQFYRKSTDLDGWLEINRACWWFKEEY